MNGLEDGKDRMSTISPTNSPFISKALMATSNGSSSSFLTSSDVSPVQKMVNAQKSQTTQVEKGSYFYSEDYLRLQAFEIRSRIVTYQNMGMAAQYAQAQQEGQVIVGAYQAYMKASVAAGEEGGKAAGAAAAKAYMQGAQRQSFAITPNVLIGA
jgi:hypothetical protein